MAKIHNGFINKNFIDSFKNTSLNNVDIATTKMYKGVKPMWKQLGFQPDNVDNNPFNNPDNKFYWKNIIPKNYKLSPQNIEGIQVVNVDVDKSISGSRTPKKPYNKFVINENSPQSWRGVNPLTNSKTYYYPEIPIIDRYGNFGDGISEGEIANGSKFYGAKTTWNGDDDSAPITNLNEVDDNLILNIDFNQKTTDELIDKTNVNNIEYSQDYEIKLDNNSRLTKDSFFIPDGIEKDKEQQAF